MNRRTELLIGAALAGILSTSPMAHADEKSESKDAKVNCYGVNSCKGKSACNTATNSCAGQNSCKGKGYLSLSKKDCLKKHGKLEEPKAG